MGTCPSFLPMLGDIADEGSLFLYLRKSTNDLKKKKKLKAQHLVVFNTLFLKTIGVNFLKLGSIANGSPTSHSTTIIT